MGSCTDAMTGACANRRGQASSSYFIACQKNPRCRRFMLSLHNTRTYLVNSAMRRFSLSSSGGEGRGEEARRFGLVYETISLRSSAFCFNFFERLKHYET